MLPSTSIPFTLKLPTQTQNFLANLGQYSTPAGQGPYGGISIRGFGASNPGVTLSGVTTKGTISVTGPTSKGTVEYELQQLVNTGVIVPTVNTYVPVYFPPNLLVNGGSGIGTQCGTGGNPNAWCSYHYGFTLTTPVNGVKYLYYSIHPDIGKLTTYCSPCGGVTNSVYNSVTYFASHELAEAITDPQVFVFNNENLNTLQSPVGWYNEANGEVVDECDTTPASTGTFVGTDGVTYTVEQLWSNKANACVGPAQ